MSRCTVATIAHISVWIAASVVGDVPPRPVALEPAEVDVLFSPRGGITDRITEEIGCATRSICIQAYSFTSKPIADALVEARGRGVHVEVCADDSNKNPDISIVDELFNQGITIYLDGKHAIAHSKVIIIDERLTISGSFNWSRSAETSNLENCLFIRSKALATQYLRNFSEHREHSVFLEDVVQATRRQAAMLANMGSTPGQFERRPAYFFDYYLSGGDRAVERSIYGRSSGGTVAGSKKRNGGTL